jgi:hypothetical protein
VRLPRVHLTYANVVSTACLFVVLGGGAYAAATLPKDSVGTKQLRRGAVDSSKVRDRSLRARDFKRGQLPAGPQGKQGLQGPPGPASASVIPAARVERAGGVGAVFGADIPWDAEIFDTQGLFDPGTPTGLTAPASGIYQAIAAVRASGLTANAILDLRLDQGAATLVTQRGEEHGGFGYAYVSVSTLVSLDAGQSIQAVVTFSGAAPSILAGSSLSLSWVGPR